MALDRDGCHAALNVDAVRQANLVYFSGGKPEYLPSTLSGTPLWESVLSVLRKGGVLAGCSAGAMILGGWIPGRPTPGTLSIWHTPFGFVSNAVILPHFDEIPRSVTGPLWWLRPRRSTVIGIDGGTALVGPPTGGDGAWELRGKGMVVVRGGGGGWSIEMDRFVSSLSDAPAAHVLSIHLLISLLLSPPFSPPV